MIGRLRHCDEVRLKKSNFFYKIYRQVNFAYDIFYLPIELDKEEIMKKN